ncbi:MAG TPA: CpsD/CapB family tyrosine-protein kinase [Steroidobacteraceae bacterium]|nr:CpsD/CapB family tyrosine-protein kinase [Steroidobacteraceae bacterium]
MDAIVRPIDAARLERERRGESAELTAGHAEPPRAAGGPAIGLTDTVIFEHPVVQLDEEHRERERILPAGAGTEAGAPYKMLRTQVMRRLADLGANSLAVLSAHNGEGKTLTAINLAIAVAAHPGFTALLVDLDLRRPSIHRRLGIEPQIGIEDCLAQRRPIYEAMVKVAGYERLTVLPARAPVPYSSELLGTQRMAELVQELRNRYLNRVLIFDLPPVLLSDDALAFSQHVQAGLLVVSEGRTAREGVTRSLTLLYKLPIVGTVLNRSQERLGSYY